MSAVSVDWEKCSEDGCVGVRSHENGKCLAHLAPDELATALERIGSEGKVDARGVEISAELLWRVLDALPRAPDGSPRLEQANFQDATFTDGASFDGVTFIQIAVFTEAAFEGDALFRAATFQGDARFDGATFNGYAAFDSATFHKIAAFDEVGFRGGGFSATTFLGNTSFSRVTFQENAEFAGATFHRYAGFSGATVHGWYAGFTRTTFKEYAWFQGATFQGQAGFQNVTFESAALFGAATFGNIAWFDAATFQGVAQFDGATFHGDARFAGRTFELARQFGPTLVLGTLNLAEATFLQPVDLDVSANRLSLAKTRFPQGGQIRARWAEIIVDDTDFGAPSILGSSPQFDGLDEAALEQRLIEASDKRTQTPRILSVRRANVGNVLFSDVELVHCRFVKARNLDGLRLEGATFAHTPRGAWARRKVLSEEHQWRANHGWSRRRRGWYTKEVRPPRWLCEHDPEVETELDPQSIAAIYRDLRKGREDQKDEPGAADFYFGEMEMRRFDKTRPRAERLILWLYWLVSGYGLRASRALISLLVTVLVFAALLYAWGFPSHRSFFDALAFSAESTTSLFRAPERELTLAGEWLQIGLRLLGPLFFGLALLSLRGRVKR